MFENFNKLVEETKQLQKAKRTEVKEPVPNTFWRQRNERATSSGITILERGSE